MTSKECSKDFKSGILSTPQRSLRRSKQTASVQFHALYEEEDADFNMTDQNTNNFKVMQAAGDCDGDSIGNEGLSPSSSPSPLYSPTTKPKPVDVPTSLSSRANATGSGERGGGGGIGGGGGGRSGGSFGSMRRGSFDIVLEQRPIISDMPKAISPMEVGYKIEEFYKEVESFNNRPITPGSPGIGGGRLLNRNRDTGKDIDAYPRDFLMDGVSIEDISDLSLDYNAFGKSPKQQGMIGAGTGTGSIGALSGSPGSMHAERWHKRRSSLEPLTTTSSMPIPNLKKDTSLQDVTACSTSPNKVKLDPIQAPGHLKSLPVDASYPSPTSSPMYSPRTLPDKGFFRHAADIDLIANLPAPTPGKNGKKVLPGIQNVEGVTDTNQLQPPRDEQQPRRGSISEIHTKFDTTQLYEHTVSPKLQRRSPMPMHRKLLTPLSPSLGSNKQPVLPPLSMPLAQDICSPTWIQGKKGGRKIGGREGEDDDEDSEEEEDDSRFVFPPTEDE